MQIPDKLKFQEIRDQIAAGNNRAEMARQQGYADLKQQTVDHKRRYENQLAKLQKFEEEK